MNPRGVRLKEPKRSELAREAYRLRLAGMTSFAISNEIDVSQPTARNLIHYGKRLAIFDDRRSAA